MATIGYRSALVQLPRRMRIRGTPDRLAWLALHLITLLGGRNRNSALVNLSWRYLTSRRGGGSLIGDDRPLCQDRSTDPTAGTGEDRGCEGQQAENGAHRGSPVARQGR